MKGGLCCHLKIKLLTFRSTIFDTRVKWQNRIISVPTICSRIVVAHQVAYLVAHRFALRLCKQDFSVNLLLYLTWKFPCDCDYCIVYLNRDNVANCLFHKSLSVKWNSNRTLLGWICNLFPNYLSLFSFIHFFLSLLSRHLLFFSGHHWKYLHIQPTLI